MRSFDVWSVDEHAVYADGEHFIFPWCVQVNRNARIRVVQHCMCSLVLCLCMSFEILHRTLNFGANYGILVPMSYAWPTIFFPPSFSFSLFSFLHREKVDLFEGKDIPQVVITIHALGRQAQKIGFKGPTLGARLSEKKVVDSLVPCMWFLEDFSKSWQTCRNLTLLWLSFLFFLLRSFLPWLSFFFKFLLCFPRFYYTFYGCSCCRKRSSQKSSLHRHALLFPCKIVLDMMLREIN